MKSPEAAASEAFAETRARTADACARVGWWYGVFTGLPAVHRHNLIWLHGFRRRPAWSDRYEPLFLEISARGSTLDDLLSGADAEAAAVMWHLIWTGQLKIDLTQRHGSVDWSGADNTIAKVAGTPANPVLIYPSAAKYQLSYQQPYIEFMSRFQISLRQPDVGLIVVGFGFNDDHLNAPIEAALRGNIGLRAAIVTPGARAEWRSDSIAWIEDLIQRGDRRLSMFTGTFDDLVKYLPEAPAREERDEHMERVSRPRGGLAR